ncbi:hypothetical protein BV898_04665 [Hypsibius exemplaris]|uniref:Caprin-1 dimerization domain-containing protein n=1 Tax=Hypsibius exemplaris TaxID=2072580 RepID=A0A1W0X281_HYPEX|nr:hypothetical protein BV898_04665 [Hypsibius exemplaris]
MSVGNPASKAGPLDESASFITEPVEKSLTELRKQVRNLEKKKKKLDTLRDDVKKSGKPLNEDQSLALSRYEEIEQQLKQCQELCKSFESCAADIQKCYKKSVKKNELAENFRFYDLEQYRAVVRALESEEILKRYGDQDEAFGETHRGHMRVLRKLLLPLRSDFHASDSLKSLNDYLKVVAEQQANLVNGRPVQLLEQPVPEAKALLDRLVASPFFSSHPELLFVKALPTTTAPGSGKSERISSSGGAGRTPLTQQNSPSKGSLDDRNVQGGFAAGSNTVNQGFHYATGEPSIPSTGMSFTNSKLNGPSQPQSSPLKAAFNATYGGPGAIPAAQPVHVPTAAIPPPQAAPHATAAGMLLLAGDSAPVVRSSPGQSAVPASVPSPVKDTSRPATTVVAPAVPPADVIRRPSESDQVSQNQSAWQSGRPFGTFDANKPHDDDLSASPDAFSSMNQENRPDIDHENKGLNNGSGFNSSHGGNNFNRIRGNGRPYEHQQDRRSFDGGRGGPGGRRFEDGRGDSEGSRGGFNNDRGMQRGGGMRGGRFMGDNRGPRGNGHDFDGGRDDGDHQQMAPKPPSGSSNDADFGTWHVDNPSFKGRTGNYSSGMSEDRRNGNNNGNVGLNHNNNNNNGHSNSNNGLRRGGPRGGPTMGAGGGGGPRGNNNGKFGGGNGYEH